MLYSRCRSEEMYGETGALPLRRLLSTPEVHWIWHRISSLAIQAQFRIVLTHTLADAQDINGASAADTASSHSLSVSLRTPSLSPFLPCIALCCRIAFSTPSEADDSCSLMPQEVAILREKQTRRPPGMDQYGTVITDPVLSMKYASSSLQLRY